MRQLVLFSVLALTACAAAPSAPAAPISQAPTIPLPPPPPADSCGATDMQWLVGKPKSQIPVPTEPQRRRVVCTTCPVTLDYSAYRLNILFDAETGIIKEVKCG
ncbi:MAG: I78 family peptidase inhibitor [Caulobacter sp.]|nr:I78 family peptidase inhibitor [Caulobacter sp.]